MHKPYFMLQESIICVFWLDAWVSRFAIAMLGWFSSFLFRCFLRRDFCTDLHILCKQCPLFLAVKSSSLEQSLSFACNIFISSFILLIFRLYYYTVSGFKTYKNIMIYINVVLLACKLLIYVACNLLASSPNDLLQSFLSQYFILTQTPRFSSKAFLTKLLLSFSW